MTAQAQNVPNTNTAGLVYTSIGNGTNRGAWLPVASLSNVNATEIQGVPVSSTAPSSGQALVYNGTKWAPATPSANATQIQGVPIVITSLASGQVLTYNGTDWVNSTVNASSIDGVTVSGTPSSGQVITATSSTTANWQTPSANATSIQGVAVFSGTPLAGQVIQALTGTASAWEYVAYGLGTPATASQATAVMTAATANIVPGSLIQLPTGALDVGSRFLFTIGINKTAAGTATWSMAVKFGTAGTTADASIASWVSGTNTAIADSATLQIIVQVLSTGGSATADCLAFYAHNSGSPSTGLGSIAGTPGATATFNASAATPYLHIDFTPGSGASMSAWCSVQRLV